MSEKKGHLFSFLANLLTSAVSLKSIFQKTMYVMRYAIWHHLYNLKNIKHTHGGVLLLVKLQASELNQIFMTKINSISQISYMLGPTRITDSNICNIFLRSCFNADCFLSREMRN